MDPPDGTLPSIHGKAEDTKWFRLNLLPVKKTISPPVQELLYIGAFVHNTKNEFEERKFTHNDKPLRSIGQLENEWWFQLPDNARDSLMDPRKGGFVKMTGLTDPSGEETLNKQLAAERANFAKKWLQTLGVPGNKIFAGRGPDKSAGREGKRIAEMRRVEMTIDSMDFGRLNKAGR